ncbi:protein bicaudal D homolog 2 [Latimeria chalumnae]|uniref:Zgc:162200 n=1 Tax=Latimeria chalumnae TaxID=7897 RepID=H3AXN4_LATCH|nr:PREDICTED: protein bicaudal D homolog 2-like [Latimeria chalumnae]|eukprot:XP_006004039.1 PREDICTED: protein bicaudal D homolog 2-like [Latimeria chalumnae]
MEQTEMIASLQSQVDRLTTELQETTEEKVQAARYGLAVLEENCTLKQKCSEMDVEYEAMKQELEQIKEALAESYSTHKKVAADGENREEFLLKESASKEAKLIEKIEEQQTEIKQMKFLLTNTQSENERLGTILQEIKKECETAEVEKIQLRDEIKEYKTREMRHLQDCADLEEENISLQKQVSVLKENQVEFEGLNYELKRRDEEIEILNGQLKELAQLKEISEQQLEEVLETLKSEREQKNNLRKELSSYFHSCDSFGNLQINLEELNLCDEVDQEDELDSGYNPGGFSKSHGEIIMSTPRSSNDYCPGPSLVSDLFSELNVSEIQKLKQQLTQVEREKSSLLNKVQDLQRQLDDAKGTLSDHQHKTEKLIEQMQELRNLQDCKELLLTCNSQEHGSGENGDYQLHVNGIEVLKRSFKAARAEIVQLKNELKEIQNKYQEGKECWEAESQELSRKLQEWISSGKDDQQVIAELEKEVRNARKVSAEAQGSLNLAQDELVSFSEELANLYHHICMCNNLTPNRVMLDYYKEGRGSRGHLKKRKSSDLFGKILLNPDMATSETGSGDLSPLGSPSSPGSDSGELNKEPMNIVHLVAIIWDQIRHLQRAVELSRQRAAPQAMVPETDKDREALVEEIMKFKSLLSTKREQIATLRTVLKANKQTAEVALSNLKSKYENEKALVSDTMVKLRNELKALKEDAATFSSLRAMFASRCDQYVSQLDEMQRRLIAAEDEKKTLNSLLRMAIQQKLALTQRLEDLEFHSNSPRRSRSQLSSKPRVRTPRASLR